MMDCGYAGHVTGGSDGQYVIKGGFSLVAGTGSPEFTFTGLGSAAGINVRGWTGGVTYNLDSDCTLSHEVLAGGGTTVVAGGADVEIRGLTRSITLTTVAATSLVQIMANTGDIGINGTGGEVRIWGSHSDVTDSSGGSVTINDEGLDTDQVTTDTAAILVDTAEIANLENISAAEVLSEVNDALDAEMPGTPTPKSINDYIKRVKFITCNKWIIDETTGDSDIHDDSNVSFATKAGAFGSLANVTTREKVI